MKFKLKISPNMSEKTSLLGSLEDRMIRIPEELRKESGFSTGLFLSLNSRIGDPVLLRVAKAYKKDAEEDDSCVYVSESTHDLLDLHKSPGIKPFDDILIGCDPEFFLVDKTNDSLLSASHFFTHRGSVGSDCGLAELRPRPHYRPDSVTANLMFLLKKAHTCINNRVLYRNKNVRLIAKSSYRKQPAGFHVHFGLPYTLLRTEANINALRAYIVALLDYYVGILSILPEGSEDSYRRSNKISKYGKPGDFRDNNFRTLEYRVPGGHLLRHPVLTHGLLSLSVVVMKDVLSRLRVYTDDFRNVSISNYDELRNLYPNLPHPALVNQCITSASIRPAKDITRKVLDDLYQMIGYKTNDVAIKRYLNYIVSYLKTGEKFSEDLESNWRLANEGQQRSVAVLSASV